MWMRAYTNVSLTLHSVLCSRGYEAESTEFGLDADTEEIIEFLIPQQKEQKGSGFVMKKPVQLDPHEEPFGAMKTPFSNDIKKYARDLDPRKGWEGQPVHKRRRLFTRVYTGAC